MENASKSDIKSSGFTPMILGGVSALAIVALVSFLVAIKRKMCCTRHQKVGYNDEEVKNSTKKIKKRKIGYDIPIESKPTVSSVIWQQEENDIAEEVKKIYYDISNSSKPVLFDSDCGIHVQTDCSANALNMQSMKATTEGNLTSSRGKIKEGVRHMIPQLNLNNVRHKSHKNSPFQRQAAAFLSKDKITGNEVQEGFMEEMRRSEVQQWVDNSLGTLNKENKINKNEKEAGFIAHGPNGACSELDFHFQIDDKGIQQHCTENFENKHGAIADDTTSKQRAIHFDNKAGIDNKLVECGEKSNNEKELKSCLKKSGSWKENIVDESFEEINVSNRMSDGNFDKSKPCHRKLTFTDNENFVTARDVKKFLVTRWVDHSVSQNKSRVTEEESDTTLAEKSANELEYEDIDSVLTSVSRMDEGRLSKIKASEFYKELLKTKINRYKALGEKIDEVSLISKEEVRRGGEEFKNGRRKGTERDDKMAVEKKKQYPVVEEGERKVVHGIERESLSESIVLDQISNDGEKLGKFYDRMKTNPDENKPCPSDFSDNENDVTLKYSIVRNFSDRLKPTIYVSLQHIRGLGKAFGYENTATARLYFAVDGEEYEESDPMKCFDDIYQEQMFSVVGTSTKAIINDCLVIEIILEDNDEPELYVKLPLEGLKHKATLIDSVIFERGQFLDES